MHGSNVILTGVPRSGTTLTCHLLNKLPNTVALHEPMPVSEFPQLGNHDAVCDTIEQFFAATRHSLLTRKLATSKQLNGAVPDNSVQEMPGDDELRHSRTPTGEILIDKPLDDHFTLAIKHPSAFTALLASLVKRFPCYAVIRNPFSILMSWQTVAMAVQNGHVPAAEGLHTGLREQLARLEDRLDRQLYVLSWFFNQYRQYLPASSVLFYENTIASGGASLSAITPAAGGLREPLESKNQNTLYQQELRHELAKRLLASDGAYWCFYSKANVEALL